MIGSREFVNSEEEFGIDDYRACLAARHANLERAIQEEWCRPVPDQLSLTALKRRRLRVKEEIVKLRMTAMPRRHRRRRLTIPRSALEALDRPGGRKPGLERGKQHAAAIALDDIATDNLIERVVRAFDQNVGL